ncbi:MAG: type IV toxin-antitoxin system AbiEi family antitoxin domain-containing protein [Pseudomonadota bacterium]
MKESILIKFMKLNNGYATTTEILRNGISYSQIKFHIKTGQIEQIKRGLYRIKNDIYSNDQDFMDVCKAIPKSVICLYSALHYYELTTFVPIDVMIAIPQGYHTPQLNFPPVQVFHFSKKQYEAGIEKVSIKNNSFRIYSPEKSICDAFRFRRKLGDDTAKEVLYNYLKTEKMNLKKLMDQARICKMANIMKPYIEANL